MKRASIQTTAFVGGLGIVGWRLVRRWSAAYRRGASARRARPTEGRAGGQADRARALPGVSVIVPAWCERGTIERCIAALAGVDYPDWEVIVVAGGGDGTLEAARAAVERLPAGSVVAGARLLEQGPEGKPAALNLGLAASRKEVVAVLDADGVVRPDWLRGLVDPLDGHVTATTGDFLPLRSTAVSRAEQKERIVVYRTRRAPFLQGSGSIAIERATLQAIGGFRPDAYADDWVLDAQLRAAALPIAFAPAARQLTDRPATLGEYWANQVRWRRAHLRSLAQVPEYFLRDGPTALRAIHPYAVGWALLGLVLSGVGASLSGRPTLGVTAGATFVLGLAWFSLGRLGDVLEAAAYTGDPTPLDDLLVPPALAVVDLAAALAASLTVGRSTLRFKGPRETAATAARGAAR